MKEWARMLRQWLLHYNALADQQIRRAFLYTVDKLEKVNEYYKTHPKAKKRTIIASFVFGPPLLFLLVVWIEIPSKRTLRNIRNQVASEVYSADSVLLGRYFIQNRTEVRYDQIAPVVFDALLATEDVRFYEHTGIDFESLGRVLVKSILMGEESSGGGSTLTQQLAKNLFPRKRYWILSLPLNKIKELITAQRLEGIYGKKELITMYLNTVPFADQAFGIEVASQRFFSKPAKYLNLDEASVLMGMLKATHYYHPRLFPERAKSRRNVVLSQMAKYNFIPKKVADSVQALPLKLNYSWISHHDGLAPYFRDFLKSEFQNWAKENLKPDGSEYNIYTDGLKIYTTLHSKLQRYAENAVSLHMAFLQKQFNDHWGREKPWAGNENILLDAIRNSPRYQKLLELDLKEEEILTLMRKKTKLRVFTWDGEKEKVMSPIDSIQHHLQFLNAGFMAMEPGTGKVRAWVGGIEHSFFQFDHVRESTKRQVGSTFKPIVYAMALEKGVDPCTLISAERQTYIDEEGEKWTPRNTQNDYDVMYSMRGALAYSVNTVSVKLILQAGVDPTVELARSMGIKSQMKNVPSLALGSASISLQEMVSAYSCFANEGRTVTPSFITTIKDIDGNIVGNFNPQPGQQVMSKETAQLVRQMMLSVVHEGTAARLRYQYGVYNDVAGKTGTTQSNADGWFLGMSPGLVAGAWVGADDPRIRFRNTELGQGSNTALPIFAYFMKQVGKDPAFKNITQSRFPALPTNLQEKLDCDLYELNYELMVKIAQTANHRDSLIEVKDRLMQIDSIAADTLTVPPETFMEKIYKRKLKILDRVQ